MPTLTPLSDIQIHQIAHRVLLDRDAQIFIWHHWGRPETRSPKWTFGQLASHFRISFSDVTRSLRESDKTMRQEVQAVMDTMLRHVQVTEGVAEEDLQPEFRITLQFGHHAAPRVDVTQKEVVVRMLRQQPVRK